LPVVAFVSKMVRFPCMLIDRVWHSRLLFDLTMLNL
jgi:hypothetical protein